MNEPRSPQGRPIVVQAGSSGAGKTLASKTADLIFTAQPTIEDAQIFYADVKSRVAAAGRQPDQVKILAGMVPTLGRSEAEAQERYEELQSLLPPVMGLAQLRDLFGGFDLSGYPLDGPLPEFPTPRAAKRAGKS